MEEKSYSQMRQEFVDLYQNEIKNNLPEPQKMRILGRPKRLAHWGVFFSVINILGCIVFGKFILESFPQIFPKIYWVYLSDNNLSFIINMFLSINILVLVFSMLLSILLSKATSNKLNSKYDNYDMKLKKYLMPKFINIFFDNGVWYKDGLYRKCNIESHEITNMQEAIEYQKLIDQEEIEAKEKRKDCKIHNLQELKLLNPYLWEEYDDVIFGNFKSVDIKIFETYTRIFDFVVFYSYLSIIIILCAVTRGVILPILLIVSIFAFLINIPKIMQQSKFRGVIVEFDMNKKFQGHTVIHEKSITAKKFRLPSVLQEVKLEASDFSNKYNVYSDNQIEARYLLTPSMMERIENLKFTFKAEYVRASFKDNKLYIAIHTGKDMLAMGNDFKDSDINTFQILYDEMISILKMVDELKLNQHIGL